MAIKVSTGLRNKMLDTGSLKTTMNLGFLKIYSGTAPASADDAVTGTLLCTISNNGTGTGVTMGTAASGVLPKNPGETWAGTNVGAGGTAGYYRFVAAGDTGASSTTEARVQGTCGTAGADLNMSSTTLAASPATTTIDFFNITFPTY